jgi:hypothetical protein
MDDGVHYAPPIWTREFDKFSRGILFLDELTTAPPAVQAALLRIILERKVGFQSLPDGVRVIAAANPPDIVSGGWELSIPLRNRFLHIQWRLSSNEYQIFLQKGKNQCVLPIIDPLAHRERVLFWNLFVSGFLKIKPDLCTTPPSDDGYAFASPRTWDFAISLMAACDLLDKAPKPGKPASAVFSNLVEGCIGRGAGLAFTGFINQWRLPDPEKILAGAEKINVKELREDELFVLFSTMGLLLGKNKTTLLDYTCAYLQLAQSVCENGKVDAIYVPLKQMAEWLILQKAVLAAKGTPRFAELERLIRTVFENTPLKDFVENLSGSSKKANEKR